MVIIKLYNYIIIEFSCAKCHYINNGNGHRLLKLNNKNEFDKENISLENTTKEFCDNKNEIEELKNRIEKEIKEINKDYERVENEIKKSYEIKHERLIKEENELKDKLTIEVNNIKKNMENMELNLSKINDILINYEKITKINNYYRIKDNQIITKLTYISDITKNQKEMKELFQQLMTNLKISFDGYNIKYDQYFFNGIPLPKNINITDVKKNSFKIAWNIDNKIKMINMDNKRIRYEIIIRKEKGKFKSAYEGKNNYCIINNLGENNKYEIRICSLYQKMKSAYTKIFKIETDGLMD